MRWLIVFPDSWIGYSPSILNLVSMLERYNQEYTIIYLETGEFDNTKVALNKYEVTFKNQLIIKVMRKLKFHKLFVFILFHLKLKKLKLNNSFDRVIGVDDIGYIIARSFYKQAIYYSLEVSNGILNKYIRAFNQPKKLIIQSFARKQYLFPDLPEKDVLYIQNSPIIKKTSLNISPYNGDLVYFGNIIKAHGVESCIEALYHLDNVKLTIKGTGRDFYIRSLKKKHRQLILNNKLVFDTKYIPQGEIFNYLKEFDIGFCFYDMKRIGMNNFNYLSSPSGKIFNYFMSSLPVIGSDLVGLQPIKESNAGVLLTEVNCNNVVNAITHIQMKYDDYAKAAYIAAKKYDYEKMFQNNWKSLCE